LVAREVEDHDSPPQPLGTSHIWDSVPFSRIPDDVFAFWKKYAHDNALAARAETLQRSQASATVRRDLFECFEV
jgi:hypothetical protein